MIKNQNIKRVGMIGAIVAAFVASGCCILPVIFAILGVGSFGFAASFEQFRPLAILLTLIFLGVGFYFTYRKKEEVCEDRTCATPKKTNLNKIILWLVTGVVVVFLIFPYLATFL